MAFIWAREAFQSECLSFQSTPLIRATSSMSPSSPCLQSATMGTSTTTFLLMEVGSMSMWMILAREAKALTRPVTRSSKRAPTEMSTSQLLMAMLAV